MVISYTSCMIDGFTIALLTLLTCLNLGKSGQGPTLGNVANTIRLLDGIVGLGNRIAYDFGRDRTTAQFAVA